MPRFNRRIAQKSEQVEFPALNQSLSGMDRFFSDVQKQQKKKPPTGRAEPEPEGEPVKRALPKGVVLGKDGKPLSHRL